MSASLAQLVRERAAQRGSRAALRWKERGAWRVISWGELRDLVEEAGPADALGAPSPRSFAGAIADPRFDDPDRIAGARARVAALGLHPDDLALALAPDAYDRDALAVWLVAGFELALPESAASIGVDVRELAPTYVFAPARTYAALHAETDARLPGPSTRRRRLIDRALARPGLLASAVVRSPLRRALGWARVRVAESIDAPLGADAARFFAAIGVPVRGPGEVIAADAAPAPLLFPSVEGL